MNRGMRKWLIAAVLFVAVGAMVFVGALAAVDFDFTRLDTRSLQTNTIEFTDDFENIFVHTVAAKVILAPSEEGVCKIEFFEEEKLRHSAKVQEGTLMIDVTDSRKWYDYIGINFQTLTIRVYLPKDTYASLSVATVTGDVEVPDRYRFETVDISGTTANISCYASVSKSMELNTTTGNITVGSTETQSIRLSATTGRITAKDVVCNHLTAKSSTAQINLENVVAEESLCVENTTGGVILMGCDAPHITVKTSTGNVKGTLRSDKIFLTDTATGSIRVPKTTHGGKCEITTSTGDIDIEIQ